MTHPSEFWDALAPHHSTIENSYLDLKSLRRIEHNIHQPVLVVGAGQGLIVAELRRNGFQCDGVDLSSEMIRYAKIRRGLNLVQADARAMPFAQGTYATIIYATGVVDFIADEGAIRAILNEGRRIVHPLGTIFVAFYQLSAPMEDFLARVGLLTENMLSHKESLKIYLLNPIQTLAWVAKKARIGRPRTAFLLFRLWLLSTRQEKLMTFRMQRMLSKIDDANSLINVAPETQPYRNEAEILNLFRSLGIPIKEFQSCGNCSIVQI
jgi:SAM-dependent methyltransferase